jgi:hypothetical protein
MAEHQALTIATATVPATTIDKYGDYAATGGPGWFGDLLKFSGKTGVWSHGPQGLEMNKGTQLVAVVPGMLAGHVKWKGGELCDQSYKSIEGFSPKAHRASLDEVDHSLWARDEDGRALDPWRESVMLPLIDPKTGSQFTFSTSSLGGVRACKRLVDAFVKQLRATPETTAGCLPVVEIGTSSYQHADRQRGTIFVPVLEGIDWTRAVDVPGLDGSNVEVPPPAVFEDHRSEKTKKRSRAKL